MKTLALLVLCLLPISAFGQTTTPSAKFDPRAQPYSLRSLARSMGNIGGWWSFLNQEEKSAYLDGYQSAMEMAHSHASNICTVLMDQVKNDQNASINQITTAVSICSDTKDSAGFEKITVKDLDEFYSDPINQAILMEWSLPYLRDKVNGNKTKGQLLDVLEAEQKDVHDCTKYPNLCKLGVN